MGSRRLPKAYNTSTYDSAGGKDYSSLALWEAATDNDLVAAAAGEVLECYRGAHDDPSGLSISGAVTSGDYFRVIRPAPGHGHAGIPVSDGSCVEFHNSDFSQYMFLLGEEHAALHDLVLKGTPTTDNQTYVVRLGATETAVIGCLIHDSSNHGASYINGIIAWLADADSRCHVVNTLITGMDRDGVDTWIGEVRLLNCTIADNGRYGVAQMFGAGVAKNCAVTGNAVQDYNGTWAITTCTPEGASPAYTDPAGDNYLLLGSDTICLDRGTDLSADPVYPFDDDILGSTRAAPWDIGFNELLFIPDIFSGRLAVSVSANSPGIAFDARAPKCTFSGRVPGITFTLNDD